MDEDFIAQMSSLVRAQNRTLTKLGSILVFLGAWFYVASMVGVLLGSREWNSVIIAAFMFPIKAASEAAVGLDSSYKIWIIVTCIHSLLIFGIGSCKYSWIIHALLSSGLLYYIDTPKPMFLLCLGLVCPAAVLLKVKIAERVEEMELGLQRLLQTEKED